MSHGEKPGLYRNVFYTIAEAAKVLGVSKMTVYRWVRRGQLKQAKVARVHRIYGADLARSLGIPMEQVPVREASQQPSDEKNRSGREKGDGDFRVQ